MRSVVNKAQMFEAGAMQGTTNKKLKQFTGEYAASRCLENKFKKNTKRINISQERAIVRAFQKFKGVKESIFYERNIESTPTIYNAVKKYKRRNKDDESDDVAPNILAAAASKTAAFHAAATAATKSNAAVLRIASSTSLAKSTSPSKGRGPLQHRMSTVNTAVAGGVLSFNSSFNDRSSPIKSPNTPHANNLQQNRNNTPTVSSFRQLNSG